MTFLIKIWTYLLSMLFRADVKCVLCGSDIKFFGATILYQHQTCASHNKEHQFPGINVTVSNDRQPKFSSGNSNRKLNSRIEPSRLINRYPYTGKEMPSRNAPKGLSMACQKGQIYMINKTKEPRESINSRTG